MRKCTPLAAIVVCVKGPEVADVLCAATRFEFIGCKAMTVAMTWLQLQLAQV